MEYDKEEELDINRIHAVLPHRFPFVMIDRVLFKRRNPESDDRKGTRLRAIKNVSINEGHFQGHFPHRPIMPGVLILEAMAQAGAMAGCRESEAKQDVMIVSMDKVKFRRPVVPGDQLVIDIEVIRDRVNMMVFDCKGTVDGVLVAQAEMMARQSPIN